MSGIICYSTIIIDNYVTLRNCLFYNNSAESGGPPIRNNANGTISNCWIFNNICTYPYPTIRNFGIINNCSIYRNIDQWYEARAKIMNVGIVQNFLIYGNHGTGIIMDFGTVSNCTVFGNITSVSEYAGGIALIEEGTVSNCIIWNNYNGSPDKGDVSIMDPVDIKIQYSCYGDAPDENGNIDDDPMFMNAELWDINNWNFRLKDESPCIDAGDPDVKFNDGCLPPGKEKDRNDMGAYGGPGNCVWPFVIGKKDLIQYFLGKISVSGEDLEFFDINKDGVVNIADFLLLIKYFPKSTIPFPIP